MHCKSCDALLSDFEATRKSVRLGDYIDLCNKCFDTIKDDIDYSERQDLLEYEDMDWEE